MAAGLLVIAAGTYWMAQLNLSVGPWQFVWPRVVLIVGVSMVFVPLNVAAFMHIPCKERAAAAAVGPSGIKLRNEGGSVGTSLGQTILERREQFHVLRLNEKLDAFNYNLNCGHAASPVVLPSSAPAIRLPARRMGVLDAVANLLEQQALSLSYFDVFWVSGVVSAVLVFLVMLMRRSVAEKGAHIAAE